jgi:spore coat protein H
MSPAFALPVRHRAALGVRMTEARLLAAAAAAALACGGGAGLPDANVPGGGGDGGGGGGGGGNQAQLPPLGDPAWPAFPTKVEPLSLQFGADTAAVVLQVWQKQDMPGQFRIHGLWHDVELRMRGDGAQLFPKHSWKVKVAKGDEVDGQRTRNYLAEYPDGGYLSDPFMASLMIGAGVPMAGWRYVTMDVTADQVGATTWDPTPTPQGIYVEFEEPDTKYSLAKNGFDTTSNVYRCGLRDCELKLSHFAAYQGPWEKHTNDTDPSTADLDAFLHDLNRTPEHEFPAWVARWVDLDRFVRYYAVGILVSLSGIDDSGSYLVHDATVDKWIWVPWDLNNSRLVFWRDNDPSWGVQANYAIPFYTLYDKGTLGVAAGKEQRYGGAHPPFVVLFQRIWDAPALRNRILDEVEKMVDTTFTEAATGPRIDALHALIAGYLPADPWVEPAHAAASVQVLKDYVHRRIAFLRAQIPLERHRGEGGLLVNAISATSVELFNADDTPRDLGGLALTNDLRARLQTLLPAGTIVPPHGKVTVPFQAGADGGEVGVFDTTTQLPLDAHFYAPLGTRTYARTVDGGMGWGWR